jgi:S1-C subfamily serine protease
MASDRNSSTGLLNPINPASAFTRVVPVSRPVQPVGVALALAFMLIMARMASSQDNRTAPAQAGGVTAGEATFRLARSISGSKGSQQNSRFVMEDPRTVFYLPEDKQVIVYFEWDGPLGQHHLEGFWKDPGGKVRSISDFNYEAKQNRFAGYWTLPLNDAMEPGIWALEAHIDGQVAGSHNFEIVVAPRPVLPPPRALLGPSEVYKLALPAILSIEKLNAEHKRTGLGSGFIFEKQWVLTTFEIIEGASSVRAILPNGGDLNFEGLVAWSRRQDWAILRMPAPADSTLSAAKPGTWQVGDRCFSFDAPEAGGRVIRDGAVTGANQLPNVGERLNVNFNFSPRASGSPVINEFGEVIGVLSYYSLVPGLSSLDVLRQDHVFSYPGNLFQMSADSQFAVPISTVQIPSLNRLVTTFADLMKSGQFMAKLVRSENILQGTIAKSIRRQDSALDAVDSKFEYQRKDGQISVLITWAVKTKIKSTAALLLYDIDNELLGTAAPSKLKLNKGALGYSSWTLDVSRLHAGLYRVDLVLGPDAIWRSFFRLAE